MIESFMKIGPVKAVIYLAPGGGCKYISIRTLNNLFPIFVKFRIRDLNETLKSLRKIS